LSNWKKALAAKKDVSLASYPKLNHLFMEGEGKSTPEEYLRPGNVAAFGRRDPSLRGRDAACARPLAPHPLSRNH